MSDCSLMPLEQFFIFIIARTVTSIRWDDDDDDDICFEKEHAYLDFYSASSLKQQSMGRHAAPLKKQYPNSKPTSLFSYSLYSMVLPAQGMNLEVSVLIIIPLMWFRLIGRLAWSDHFSPIIYHIFSE